VPELAVLVALIVRLDDDGLAAGEAPLQQDDDLAALAARQKDRCEDTTRNGTAR
jgi:hypothetical protein